MKISIKWPKIIFVIFASVSTGCTTAQIQAYNESQENIKRSINNPTNTEDLKTWYFSIMPNPYEQIYPINALGNWVFDGMRCQVNQINEKYYAAHLETKRLPASSPHGASCTPSNQTKTGNNR